MKRYMWKKTNFSNGQKFQIDIFNEIGNIHKNDKSRNNQNNLNYNFDKNKIKSKEFIENKEDDIEYDDLPFTMALKLEKRNIFYIFRKKITEKIKIFDIFVNRRIKEIILSEYILYLLIDLTFNALLYSDKIV